ncbi:hypothetical protein N8768_05710 [Flavobacteriaceae bacterium]|nr:hypothetical protein [Flavobacteriaceae bacterium]
MRNCLKPLLKYFFHLVLFFVVLDIVFSLISSLSIRHKGSWIADFKNEKFDYIVLGNSRAFSAFDIKTIETITNLKGVNLAVDAASPVEMSMIYEYFSKHNDFEHVILLIDDKIIASKNYNKKAIKHFLPFMYTDYRDTFLSLNKREEFDIPLTFYIPFYRYVEYSSEIGLREVFLSVFANSHRFDENGFKLLKPKKMSNKVTFSDDFTDNDNLNNLMSEIAMDNKNLIKVNLPYYSSIPIRLKDANEQYNVLDYTGYVNDKSLFNDNIHLNMDGAKYFCTQFSKDLMNQLNINKL